MNLKMKPHKLPNNNIKSKIWRANTKEKPLGTCSVPGKSFTFTASDSESLKWIKRRKNLSGPKPQT